MVQFPLHSHCFWQAEKRDQWLSFSWESPRTGTVLSTSCSWVITVIHPLSAAFGDNSTALALCCHIQSGQNKPKRSKPVLCCSSLIILKYIMQAGQCHKKIFKELLEKWCLFRCNLKGEATEALCWQTFKFFLWYLLPKQVSLPWTSLSCTASTEERAIELCYRQCKVLAEGQTEVNSVKLGSGIWFRVTDAYWSGKGPCNLQTVWALPSLSQREKMEQGLSKWAISCPYSTRSMTKPHCINAFSYMPGSVLCAANWGPQEARAKPRHMVLSLR